jgi:hypothetical protein
MRRNYGSLNLAALDLHHASGATVDPSFHDAALTHELAHLEMVDHDDCASSVGFPMESLAALMEGNDDVHVDADALSPPLRRKRSLSEHGLHAEIRAASSVSTSIPISSPSTTTATTPTSAPVAVAPKYSNSYTAAAPVYQHQIALDLPPRLVEQHHIELNALRCLSLKMMLSASSVSTSSSTGGGNVLTVVPQPSTSMPKMNSFEFDMGCQPQSDRVKTTLLATRRGSLPRNMIQSV